MDANGNFQNSVSDKGQLIWSDQPKPLTEILDESILPIIAKVYTDETSPQSENHGNFDIYQPLLIYKEIIGKKVYAKNVPNDVLSEAKCNEDGPIIVIPTSYKGWFRLADDEDKPLTTISNVARIMPVKFLSSKFLSGFVATTIGSSSNRSDYMHQKVEIQPGVFHVQNIYEDFVRYSHKNVTKRKLLRCLRCCLDDGTEVLLPFESEGCFHLIEVKMSVSKQNINLDNIGFVYTISDMIIAGLTKDVVLNLVHGRPPKRQCGFTSLVKVCDLIKDRTIVACTLNKEKRLLELPLSPFPLFVKALNDTDLLVSNPLFAEAVLYMEMVADEYANELKARYNYSVSNTASKTDETLSEENEKENVESIEESKWDENDDEKEYDDVFQDKEDQSSEEETTKL